MEIALVFPKSTFLNAPLTWGPLGLWYLAAQLEAQGHHTEFFDLSEDELPEDGDFDQLWVSATAPQMAEIKRIAKVTMGWTKTSTVLGGPAPWANPGEFKDMPYDLIVSGEGDHPDTIRAIAEEVASSSDMTIMGGGLIHPSTSKTLEWVLPPVRRWARRYKAHMRDQTGKLRRMTSLFTTRGCPMSCSFCASGRLGKIWDRRTRYEPLSVVEHQIRESVEMGFDGLSYYDDIFVINRARTAKLLNLHQEYGVVFRCFLRSDILHAHGGRRYLKAMVRGGLIEVFVGVESADNRIKKNISKGTTIEQDTAVLEWCKELGVTCKMSFILGLPGESLDSLNRTWDWILEHRPHRVQVDRLIPFPGTPLADHPENYDLTYERQPDEDWFFCGRRNEGRSFVSTSALSVEEIDAYWRGLQNELHREGLLTFSEGEKNSERLRAI